MASEQWTETGIGALVLAAAASFLVYALARLRPVPTCGWRA